MQTPAELTALHTAKDIELGSHVYVSIALDIDPPERN